MARGQSEYFHKTDTAILGAGLAGLSAAYHGGGVVYEKERGIGGTCRTPKIKGYSFDLGIHVLHTKNKYVLSLLTKKLTIPFRIQRRRAWIYSYHTFTRYPFQVNTYGLPAKIIKDCLLGFINVYREKNVRHDNYEKWIYSAFGKGIAEHFLLPYSNKFWTVSARQITTDWLGFRVPRPKLEDVLQGAIEDKNKGFGPNWRFRYPKDCGIGALPEAFDRQGLKIHLNKEAAAIDVQGKKITFKDGCQLKYNKLISTIPLPELIRIIEDSPEDVREAANRLKFNSIFCVNLGIRNPDLNPAHWIYYPKRDYSFFRISFLNNFSGKMTPRGRSSVMAEVSYSDYKKIDKKTIAEKVIKDLIKAKVIKPKEQIELVNTQDIRYAYVIYDHNRIKCLLTIKKFLNANDIYPAGRYGSWEYYWMDDAILDGRQAADFILRKKNEGTVCSSLSHRGPQQ